MFDRIDIFKMVKTKTNKNKMGIKVITEILLKTKNRYAKKSRVARIITTFLNTEIIAKE